MWLSRPLVLAPRRRGLHLITGEIQVTLPELRKVHCGLLHVFIEHTSAGLTINENADRDVPWDLGQVLDTLVPEDFPYRHTCEGPDDMPAHVKASLVGCSLSIPVAEGRLRLGTWQGIFLCEFRDRASERRLMLTLQGDSHAG